jgi:hypothetical protein
MNPKKMVKQGFVCIGDHQVQCCHCQQTATIPQQVWEESSLKA